ncbi:MULTISPECIES: helix-turn-helix domain-containing protein [unclassified Rhizobium]|jgi:CRP-like cAMP-binding protein|uniref:helix-turn-helix domain-containing protein n=1 Tax=unclassified Rhizobium TaxID=2613769 RepID=UPI001A9A0405|nr:MULTISPECIES: helix-turn-helix domain-containing protein [unclassified Rhizobium]MBX5159290.1 helix-turn-helix domain-containing protein [Rhizobium sp. NZLR8]MBX5162034.1 helix-turn-helix domain-containing protein [Rhizobium sp. NZLR4b]MBX5171092.1 helix-turn-helix domain-containing protein [Rhizobium sp. NZLR1b]MBX5188093.1 helix-turn-helix domain-containing protein [Rhizobium sp. NZLR3b]MBX5197723.1 helix-turn-helix domain-containing protein [Rhizobium sp. NZLR10]
MNTAFNKPARVALVVEDDYVLASDLASKLSEAGMKIIGPAPNVQQALNYIDDGSQIDVAVLDINLSGTMVFPVADELSKRNIPFFFATGYSRDVVPPRFADRIFVEKPLDKSAIFEALSNCRGPAEKASGDHKNLILSALSSRESDVIQPHLKSIRLVQGEILERQFGEITAVSFVEAGIVSLIALSLDGAQVEAGLIGREGVTGTGLLEGDWRTPYAMMVQIEGTAQRIDVDSFLRLTQKAPQLRSLSSSFSRSLGIQISYTALANGRYSIEQRLARWLLMLNDRADSQVLNLTHQYMSFMLGVRRSGVTGALHVLEGEKLIRSVRGKVIVVDRDGLVLKAHGSYGIPEAEYERLMGFSLRGAENISMNSANHIPAFQSRKL